MKKPTSLQTAILEIEQQKAKLAAAIAKIRQAKTRQELVTCWNKYITLGYVNDIWPVSELPIKDAICLRARELGLLAGGSELNAD